MHAGVELLGADAPEGTAEVIEVLSAALDAVGLEPRRDRARRRRPLPPAADRARGRGRGPRRASSTGSPTHDLVGLEAEVDEVEGLDPTRAARPCCACPACAAAPRSSSRRASSAAGRSSAPTQRLQATYEALVERGVADRVQLDLSLLRDLGYYTGAILEVYDPALGHILGGGGRYDDLLGRFGARAAGGRLQPLPRARAPRPDGGGAHRPRRRSDEPRRSRHRSAPAWAGR